MTLTDLIARLEAATAPDRELDAEIAVTVFGGEIVWKTANFTMEQYPARRFASSMHVGGYANEHVPLFTTSLDDALTLFPADTINRDQRLWWCDIDGLLGEWPVAKAGKNTSEDVLVTVQARTPALALCIAALRAREAGDAG